MVSCLATASSRTVESTARRRLPFRTPVSATTSAMASMIRCGFPDPARRLRQYVSVLGWNALSVNPYPHAAFQRRSYVNASAVSRSERPCNACNTSTDPMTGAGTDGRPRRDGKRSSIIESGNSRPRCLARNAKTLPGANNSPASASTSKYPRCASSRPCIRPVLTTKPTSPADAPHIRRLIQQPPSSTLLGWWGVLAVGAAAE
jgi:hypothetical protein